MSIPAMKWAEGVLTSHDLTQSQRLVLLCLAYHHHNGTGACFPSVETLGLFAGISPRRARMGLRDLESVGLISTRKRVTSQGQASNQYDLFGRFKRADKKSRARADASVRGGGGTPVSADKEHIYKGRKASSSGLKIVGGRDA